MIYYVTFLVVAYLLILTSSVIAAAYQGSYLIAIFLLVLWVHIIVLSFKMFKKLVYLDRDF